MLSLFYHLKLLRPLNVIIGGAAMVISAIILNQIASTNIIFYTSFVVMLYTAGANALNDALDSEIDLINQPQRPIPSGNVTVRMALIISFILFLIGAILCLQLNDSAKFLGIAIAIPLMVFYSTHLKRKGIYGNITVAFILAFSFLFAGSAHGRTDPMWIPMLLSFGLSLVREIVKDVADIEGDKSSYLSTYPITKGIKNTNRLIVILSVIICVGSLIPYYCDIYGIWYLIILLVGVEIPLLFIVVLLIKNPSNSTASICARILKFSTIAGLVAIYLGAL